MKVMARGGLSYRGAEDEDQRTAWLRGLPRDPFRSEWAREMGPASTARCGSGRASEGLRRARSLRDRLPAAPRAPTGYSPACPPTAGPPPDGTPGAPPASPT